MKNEQEFATLRARVPGDAEPAQRARPGVRGWEDSRKAGASWAPTCRAKEGVSTKCFDTWFWRVLYPSQFYQNL